MSHQSFTGQTCPNCTIEFDSQWKDQEIVFCPLHAAAPALLGACRATTTNGHYNQCLAGQRGHGTCSAICETVKAAIAEATGKRTLS